MIIFCNMRLAFNAPHASSHPSLSTACFLHLPVNYVQTNGPAFGVISFLTHVWLLVQGTVLLVLQKDRPGLIAAVGQELAKADVNISFMTVSRTQPGKDAVMAIGIDGQPPQSVLDNIPNISGIKEFALFDGPQ